MLLLVGALLLSGFPVAFALSGGALLTAAVGYFAGVFDADLGGAIPSRLYGIMRNETLLAVPLFVFMGVLLERGKISEELLRAMGRLFGRMRGGLAVSVCLVGAILAASTGIVGATVVTMGLISLPVMLRNNYQPALACGVITASGTLGQIIPPSIVLVILGDVISNANQKAQLELGNFSPEAVSVGDLFFGALIPMLRNNYQPALACGVITASGTLGQIIPPSIVLVILGDVISNANQKAQLELGNFSPEAVSVGDLFFGALIPGLMLVGVYIVYVLLVAWVRPGWAPAMLSVERPDFWHTMRILVAPIALIIAVLGSILSGIATPTEAAAVGAGGAMILGILKKSLTREIWRQALQQTTRITCMVFVILIGASIFSLVFRGFGGDEIIAEALSGLPGGVGGAFFVVMALMFVLGFFLDFIEIVFVVVPIVAPILIKLGVDPVWLGVMFALNLQTSFLTPPFGFALFYLRGVAPRSLPTAAIYRGALPFVGLQLLILTALWFFPSAATWLPSHIYR